MERRTTSWFSPNLQMDMPLVAYGYSGQTLLMLPTAAADYLEYERFYLVDAIKPFIEHGKIRAYSINSVNKWSLLNKEMPPKLKAELLTRYDRYITEEVLPLIRNENEEQFARPITTGASLGAYLAANEYFKHPDLFRGTIPMSGSYDIRSFLDGYYDDNVYFNNPVDYLAQMVRRFGIKVPMAPYLPSALGATEVPLDQMVSAYSAFPNKGVRVEPHMVRKVLDRDGAVLEEWEKTTYKVVNEYVALTMVSMMRGVVQGGTASAAQALGIPLAGKTGTVNDHTDVWFLGYTPTYVTGVWMGYPGRKKPLGNEMTGAHGALPFFMDFMKDFMKDKPKEDFPKAPTMPEDMKEMFKQRQRELQLERAQMQPEASPSPGDENTAPSAITTPKLEDTTLPPAPRVDQPREPVTESPKPQAPPPSETGPKPETRPREAEPAKKKGKKGEPDGPGE